MSSPKPTESEPELTKNRVVGREKEDELAGAIGVDSRPRPSRPSPHDGRWPPPLRRSSLFFLPRSSLTSILAMEPYTPPPAANPSPTSIRPDPVQPTPPATGSAVSIAPLCPTPILASPASPCLPRSHVVPGSALSWWLWQIRLREARALRPPTSATKMDGDLGGLARRRAPAWLRGRELRCGCSSDGNGGTAGMWMWSH